jgi:hypothetical protein
LKLIVHVHFYLDTHITGAKLSPLHLPASIALNSSDSVDTFLIFGGLNTTTFAPSNDLYVVTAASHHQKPSAHVRVHLETMPHSDMFQGVDLQTGRVPSPRFGHTLTNISATTSFLVGGVTMSHRSTPKYNCSNTFQVSECCAKLYLLDFQNSSSPHWTVLDHQSATLTRAFHSSTYLLSRHSIAVIGGTQYARGVPTARLNCRSIVLLDFTTAAAITESILHLTAEPMFISYHSSLLAADGHIMVYGGFQSLDGSIACDTRPDQSNILINIDVNAESVTTYTNAHSVGTSSPTLTFLDNDTLLILGGSEKATWLYSPNPLIPDKCVLDTLCHIEDTDISPIPWIMCEFACQGWYHMYCVGLQTVPAGPYRCTKLWLLGDVER